MLYGFTKRLFHWFVELFDHKIVPNIPTDTPSFKPLGKGSSDAPQFLDVIYDLKSRRGSYMDNYWLFTSSNSIESTPWYKDWSTLLYIAGGIVTIGTLYLGYKIIADPSIIWDWFKSAPNITNTDATPTNSSIELTDTRTAGPSTGPGTIAGAAAEATGSNVVKDFSKGIVNMYNKTVYKLNPLHWFATSAAQLEAREVFMDHQLSMNTQNKQFYPFTADNPFDSWLKKLRIRILGETAHELDQRVNYRYAAMKELEDILRKGKEVASLTNSPVPSTSGFESLTAYRPSPGVSPLGLGLSKPLTNLPVNDIALGADWISHEVDRTIDPVEAIRAWKDKNLAFHAAATASSQPVTDAVTFNPQLVADINNAAASVSSETKLPQGGLSAFSRRLRRIQEREKVY